MDLLELVANKANGNKRASLTSEQKPPAAVNFNWQQLQYQVECLRKDIAEVRGSGERKVEKRELMDLKLEIQK
jgi:hypothetical protein